MIAQNLVTPRDRFLLHKSLVQNTLGQWGARQLTQMRFSRAALAVMTALLLSVGFGSLAHAQSSASDRLQNAGVATADQVQALSNQIDALEREHQAEIERIERDAEAANSELRDQIEALERRLSRIEKARQMDERRNEQASFEKSRMLNWPKTKSGMNRRQIYRLIGSGVKDRTETQKDCRCYSQGRICFNDEELAQKSNVRCQL